MQARQEPALTYHRPKTLDAALDIAAHGARAAAGCTDLFPATTRPALELAYAEVLDLTAVAGLRSIAEDDTGWRIGATTTWTDLIRADLPPAFDSLKLAAREVGSVQIQNSGTIAGNLCNASPAADGVPPLLVLDASVEVRSVTGKRVLPLADFLTGPRRTALNPGEIVTAVLIPRAAGAGRSHFLKLGARKYLVISIAMVAVRLVIEDGKITDATLAIGSCGPVASRLAQAEVALIGAVARADSAALVTDALVAEALSPIDDMRADAAYRARSAAVITRRAIAGLLGPAS
ncbi:MAG: FAD binding domain-containing protein [Pseudomonadota bacterium]